MKIDPLKDGIDHINVYSKGRTELGRLLSNFADTPFEIIGKGKFRTVEGFWYWTMTGLETLRDLPGWECKKVGKEATRNRTHPTATELLEAYRAKIAHNPYILELLLKNDLPFKHYYVYNGKVIEATEWLWTARMWERFKR